MPLPTASSSNPPQVSARRNPTSGVVALVMGVPGLSALPLIGSVLALVFDSQSRTDRDGHPDVYADDLGRVGRVLGWVGAGVAAAAPVALIALLLFLLPVRSS